MKQIFHPLMNTYQFEIGNNFVFILIARVDMAELMF